MANNTGINPWAAGAVVFNNQPWMAFYERQALRQQAKQDAMENYFRDLNKNITPTGVRSQDVSGLLNRNKEWQQYYQQNKAAILNPRVDGGKAYSDYMTMYNDQLGYIDRSKEMTKGMDQIGKLRFNPASNYVFEDPHFMETIDRHNLPIDDPNHQAIDYAHMTMPDKPLETKDLEAYQKYLTGGLKTDAIAGAPINLGNFKIQTPINHQYSGDNLKAIGQRSMAAFDTDRRWRTEATKVFNEIMHDPVKYEQLNRVYKQAFGNDIDTPREARAAQDMVSNALHSVEYKLGEDTFGKQKAMAKINHDYRMDEIEARAAFKGLDAADMDDRAEGMYSALKADALKNPRRYKTADGKETTQYEVKTGGLLSKAFAVPGASGHTIYPDYFRYDKDMKTVTPIFLEHEMDSKKRRTEKVKHDANGNAAVISDLSRPILESEFKEQYKKQLMGVNAYGKTLLKKKKTPDAPDHNIDELRKKYNY